MPVLVASITVPEILMTSKSIIAVRFEPMLLYCEAALIYLIFSTMLTWLQGKLEKKLGRFFQGKTQTEVAKEIGISQAQISRLEKGAITKIREASKI